MKRKNKENKNQENKNKSLIFVNSPIQNEQQDVLGIKTYADRINQAIDDGANIIGVIGDYGTGKSSLIELIKSERKNCININMWGNEKDEKEKNALTKNFLFQMSLGKDKNFARYISKKLSKNYGMLSLVLSDRKALLFLLIPGLFYLIYLIISDIQAREIVLLDNQVWLEIAKWPILAIAVCAVAVLLSKKPILFSLKDSQGKIEPNENDLYDIYVEIADKLASHTSKKKKRIIIIDDLDRANNKDEVRDFIKEIYKFNSFLNEKIKKKLVFVIEVKSEYSLKSIDEIDKSIKVNDDLYKKVFYFRVNLNTIHYSDYYTILKQLLIQKQNEGKEILKEVVEVDYRVLNKFAYIIKGENLTIRDIKDRLNRSFEIYENLIKKSEELKKVRRAKTVKKIDGVKSFATNDNLVFKKIRGAKKKSELEETDKTEYMVRYDKCALVAYLENKYPEDMLKFVKAEREFNNILDRSYVFKQENNSLEIRTNKIKKVIDKSKKYSSEFTYEIAEMIAGSLIDEDFKMYFYNYPSGKEMKTMNITYLERVILYPRENKNIDEKKIKEALSEDYGVQSAIMGFARRESLNLVFGKNILENKDLYEIALRYFEHKVLEVLKEEVKWKSENLEESARIMEKIFNYNIRETSNVMKEYALYLREEFENLNEDEVINARKKIIEKDKKKYILLFKELFVGENMLLITEQELELIYNVDIKLELINEKIIDLASVQYILKCLNELKLSEENCDRVIEIYKGMSGRIELATIASSILRFLSENIKMDDELFIAISEAFIENKDKIEENEIVEYLNKLNKDEISSLYLKKIYEMQLDENLSEDIHILLKENGYRYKYNKNTFVELVKKRKFDKLDLQNDVEEKIKLINRNYNLIKNNIVELRKEIISKGLHNTENDTKNMRLYQRGVISYDELIAMSYKSLFVKPYPIITKEEIDILSSVQEIEELTDFKRAKNNEILYIVERINNISYDFREIIDVLSIINNQKENDIEIILNSTGDPMLVRKYKKVNNLSEIEDIPQYLKDDIIRVKDNYNKKINVFWDNLYINSQDILRLNDEDRTKMYEILKEPLKLSKYKNAMKFSEKIGYIVTEIDKEMGTYFNVKSDEEIDEVIDSYIELVYKIDISTGFTLMNISVLMGMGVEFKLGDEILKSFFRKKMYDRYIIGKILKEGKNILELDKIPLEEYIDVYNKTNKVYNIMNKSKEFKKLVMDNKAYNLVSNSKIKDFYEMSYSVDFIKYVFDTLEHNEVIDFVKNYMKLEERDFSALTELIIQKKYSWILKDEEVYTIVWNMLNNATDRRRLTSARKRAL